MIEILDKTAFLASTSIAILGVTSHEDIQKVFGTMAVIASAFYCVAKLVFFVEKSFFETKQRRQQHKNRKDNK